MPTLGQSPRVESNQEARGWWRRGPTSIGADRGWWWPDPGEEATDRWRGGWIEEGEPTTERTTAAQKVAGGPASDPMTAGWVALDPALLAGGQRGVDQGEACSLEAAR
jgi:hypothetical protein